LLTADRCLLMDFSSRIYVAGAGTMIGRAIRRRLVERQFTAVIDRPEPDPVDAAAVEEFFGKMRPEYVFLAAGKNAGIGGNTARPADLMIDNLLVAGHVIPAASRFGVRKLLYLASSCAYPKDAPHPLRTASLWTGRLEPTSEAYAVAKLAGVMLCQAFRKQYGAPFIAGIAGDAYGPHDDFSPDDSHVDAGLIRRIDEAKSAGRPYVDVWGSGAPRREFIYVDDLADACVFVMQRYDGAEPINLGVGRDESIGELAAAIREVAGYGGELRFDRTRPDGMPYKGLDSTVLAGLGWTPQWTLRRGLEETYRWYLSSAR
jgi:GDP-L-fucose synthase